MRQRNDSGHPLTVHTDPPQQLLPGEQVDHPSHVIGLTPVDDTPEADTADTDQPTKPAKPGRTSAKEATN